MTREQYKTQYEREDQILEAIVSFRDIYGYSPSYSQLSKITGISKSRVAQIINDLTLKKLIAKDGSKTRTIKVLCK